MTRRVSTFSFFVAFIASFAGVLFGYHTSVISGTLAFLDLRYMLTLYEQAFLVSIVLLGALIGALFGGTLADYIGRKKTLFLSAILFAVGTFFLVSAHSKMPLFYGRAISGFALGLASIVAPLYIAEMAPPQKRGMLVSFNQLAITVGIFFAYFINYSFSDEGQWRWMFGFAFLPNLVLLIGLFLIPETPSFLFAKGREKKAKEVMRHIFPEKENLTPSLEGKHPGRIRFRSLFDKSVRYPFFIGICMAIFQQITGINTIIYYAPRIFSYANYPSDQSALFATLGIGIVNVVMTLIALPLIDLWGRRPLLITGISGMVLSLLYIGFAFHRDTQYLDTSAVISLMVYIAFFAISLGPIAWLLISEIFPIAIRGSAMGIAIFCNWASNYLVSFSFPLLLHQIGPALTFWLYALIGIVALFFILFFVPETKEKSFAEIQNFWNKKKKKG